MLLFILNTIPAVGTDFMDFSIPEQLTFDESTDRLPVTITIIDDSILESTEDFFAMLATSDAAVNFNPQQATINILEDNDGKSISLLYYQST